MSLVVPVGPWVSLGIPGGPWVSLGVPGVPGGPWVSILSPRGTENEPPWDQIFGPDGIRSEKIEAAWWTLKRSRGGFSLRNLQSVEPKSGTTFFRGDTFFQTNFEPKFTSMGPSCLRKCHQYHVRGGR